MPIPVFVHLALLALMVVFCILAAVTAWKRSGNWLSRHRWFGAIGACSGLIGIAVMVSEKIEHGYPHFASPHAILGLTIGILLVVVPLLGFFGSRGYNTLRGPHRILARILILLGLLGLASGVLRYLQISKPNPS
ncbi:MAG: hypothetical protein WCS52_02965 [bacterium]